MQAQQLQMHAAAGVMMRPARHLGARSGVSSSRSHLAALQQRPTARRAAPRLRCSAAASAVAQAPRPEDKFEPQVCVVLGTQWGDEGKGKLVDILAQEYEIVARAQVRGSTRSTACRRRCLFPSGCAWPAQPAGAGSCRMRPAASCFAGCRIRCCVCREQ